MKIKDNILRYFGLTTNDNLNRHIRLAENRGYKAAQINRLSSDFIGTSNSINREVRTDMVKVRNRARALWREDDYLQAYKHSLKANIIGPKGIILQSKIMKPDGTEDTNANNMIEKAWNKWCRKEYCTMSGRHNMRSVQLLAAEHLERDGEFGLRMVYGIDKKKNPFGFSLELFEPDDIDETFNNVLMNGNTVIMGVEVDKWKKPVAYWMKKRDASFEIYGSSASANQYELERVDAEDIIFLIDPEHTNQLRAVSPLASTLLTHHHLNGYIEAHVIAARGGANKMLFIERDVNADDSEYEGDEVDEDGNKIEYMSPGLTEYLQAGERANAVDPSFPQGEFWSFLKAMLRKIFLSRGIDYNSTSGDLEGVSYSAMRSGKEYERTNYMMKQQHLEEYLMTPVYERWLKFALLYGAVNLSYSDFDKWNAPVWIPKRWSYFDPLKDAQAAVLKINNGLSTRTKEASINGDDYADILQSLANEKAEEIKLNINYGAPKDEIEFIDEATEKQSGEENDDENAGIGPDKNKRTGTDGGIFRIK